MFDKLIKGALLFTAGAAVGAAGAMWLMSDSGKQVRGELRNLASQAKDKIQECYEQVKQEMEAENGKTNE
jgi:gas vesicle protein